MQFQLITPERTFFSGQAQGVTIPGTEGYFGVLDGHAPIISTLRPGVVTVTMSDGKQQKVAVLGGVAEATADRCSVLAEVAKSFDGMTRDQAAQHLQTAQKAFKDAIHEEARQQAEVQLQLAEIMVSGV